MNQPLPLTFHGSPYVDFLKYLDQLHQASFHSATGRIVYQFLTQCSLAWFIYFYSCLRYGPLKNYRFLFIFLCWMLGVGVVIPAVHIPLLLWTGQTKPFVLSNGALFSLFSLFVAMSMAPYLPIESMTLTLVLHHFPLIFPLLHWIGNQLPSIKSFLWLVMVLHYWNMVREIITNPSWTALPGTFVLVMDGLGAFIGIIVWFLIQRKSIGLALFGMVYVGAYSLLSHLLFY
jgi:hypothetical protein